MLANRSYTRRTAERGRHRNGTVRFRTRSVLRVTRTPNGSRFRTVTRFGGPRTPPDLSIPDVQRVDLYAAEGGYVRFTYENGSHSYGVFPRVDTRAGTVRLLFEAFETRIAGRTTCGERRCYRVASSSVARGAVLAAALVAHPAATVTGGTLVALVDDRGFVDRYRVRYTVSTPDTRYTVVREVRYGSVGTTTVDRPGWVGRYRGDRG